jgi:hypothetical protein
VAKPDEGDIRRRIGQHARAQGGYTARLYRLWEAWNLQFFGGEMTPALILLAEPSNPRRLGDCSPYAGVGDIRSRIRIRPSILEGNLRYLRTRARKGLERYCEDVLLHEMIHQYAQEITGENDDSYNGHGPAFSAKANEIGKAIGIPEVRRTYKARDGEDMVSPAHWPHAARDPEYYLGAYVPTSIDKPKKVSVPVGDVDLAVAVLLKHFDRDELFKRWPAS